MVAKKRPPYKDEPTQEFQVVPGPAKEAEGTIHPPESVETHVQPEEADDK